MNPHLLKLEPRLFGQSPHFLSCKALVRMGQHPFAEDLESFITILRGLIIRCVRIRIGKDEITRASRNGFSRGKADHRRRRGLTSNTQRARPNTSAGLGDTCRCAQPDPNSDLGDTGRRACFGTRSGLGTGNGRSDRRPRGASGRCHPRRSHGVRSTGRRACPGPCANPGRDAGGGRDGKKLRALAPDDRCAVWFFDPGILKGGFSNCKDEARRSQEGYQVSTSSPLGVHAHEPGRAGVRVRCCFSLNTKAPAALRYLDGKQVFENCHLFDISISRPRNTSCTCPA